MPRCYLLGFAKTPLLVLILLSVFTFNSISKDSAPINYSNIQQTKNIASMPLTFTVNNGQWDDNVKFRANAGGATMWFAPDGAYYQFTRTIESDETIGQQMPPSAPDLMGIDREPKAFETMMIKANFVGANANPIMTGVDMIDYKCNYFIGNDQSKWATDVPNYTSIKYEEIYDGIDLKYYGNDKQMEYDFIVSPGADYEQIQIKYEGAESIHVNEDGQLVVTTLWGEVIEQRPIIYQLDDNNNRVSITGEYKIKGTSTFGFELEGYDPALPLVIDPILTYSTYLGGSYGDDAYAIAVDATGAAYITGNTSSNDFPIIAPYQSIIKFGSDVFVTKISSTGNSLLYSTFIGGNSNDFAFGMELDTFNSIYLTGQTYSTDYPTLNPYQATYQGNLDAFVTKLSSSGNSLIYSTYLGGIGSDVGLEIETDNLGNAVIVGHTESSDFPIQDPFQSSILGPMDVFVTKLNALGDALLFSTYIGGSSFDYPTDLTIDSSGNAYLVGATYSTDFPTLNEYQSYPGGILNGFILKLNTSGSALTFSTYLGGSSIDLIYAIAIDQFRNCFVTGSTSSSDFPVTPGAFRTTYKTYSDLFVTKLYYTGDSLLYSTFLGGDGGDFGLGIQVDSLGNAYVTGYTNSIDYPIKLEFQAYQADYDVFLTKLSTSGNILIFSSYFGGDNSETGRDIAIDDAGNIFLTGVTASTNFPTKNAYLTTLQGLTKDSFVAKFAPAVTCCDLAGDFDGSDGVDIADLTTTVNWMFKGGPPADCVNNADVDASCDVDVADLTYRVNYIFKGGPDLVCGCVG